MPKLTQAHVDNLKKLLRASAGQWGRDPCHSNFNNGICWALRNQITDPHFSSYQQINELLLLAEDGWNVRCQLEPYGWANGVRASMCLLLAEWIETDFTPEETS